MASVEGVAPRLVVRLLKKSSRPAGLFVVKLGSTSTLARLTQGSRGKFAGTSDGGPVEFVFGASLPVVPGMLGRFGANTAGSPAGFGVWEMLPLPDQEDAPGNPGKFGANTEGRPLGLELAVLLLLVLGAPLARKLPTNCAAAVMLAVLPKRPPWVSAARRFALEELFVGAAATSPRTVADAGLVLGTRRPVGFPPASVAGCRAVKEMLRIGGMPLVLPGTVEPSGMEKVLWIGPVPVRFSWGTLLRNSSSVITCGGVGGIDDGVGGVVRGRVRWVQVLVGGCSALNLATVLVTGVANNPSLNVGKSAASPDEESRIPLK